MPPTSALLVIGAVAMGTTFVLTPVVIFVAKRMGWVVEPDARRVHTKTMPDVGGLAMIIAVVVAIGVARLWDVFDPMFARNSEPTGVVLAAVAIFIVGFLDDLRDLSAPAKVAGTVAVGMILVTMGVTMYYFRLPWLGVFVPGDDWMPLVTLIWLLLMTQAINLIDGLDGLAAGIVAIAAGAFFLYSLRLSELDLITPPNVGPLVAIITVGVCVGFLPWNFNPARIFMGDGGALLLGLLLAVSTSVVGGRADPTEQKYFGQTWFFLAPMLIPILILGVPIFDTLFAILRRARTRTLATADRRHLHHRLIEMGHGPRRAVVILWCWTALLSGVVLYPAYTGKGTNLIPLAFGMLALLMFTMLHPQIRRNRG